MPQLSPLNWIFLFLLAWSSIFLVFMIFWWQGKSEYSTDVAPSKKSSPQNSWHW